MHFKSIQFFILIFSLLLYIPLHSQDLDDLFKDKKEVYFKFKFESVAKTNSLSNIISIDHKSNKKEIYAYANKSEFEQFLKLGIKHEVIADNVPISVNYSSNKNNWDYYPTYTEYTQMMQMFADSFPNICKLHNLGTLSSGKEVLCVQISNNVGVREDEPSFLYTSSMHGNELTGYVLMLRLIDEMLNGYGNNMEFTDLINSVDIWINPLANPNGAYASGNTISGATRYNANGVDLNRNFPDPQDGSNPDGNPWQEETIIFMDIADSIPFDLSCNIHTGAEVFNYPWDTWSRLTADDNWWTHIASHYADTAHVNSSPGYFNDLNNGITNGWDWYEVNGGRQDFMNYFKLCRESTLELSSNKIPNPTTLPYYWNANKRSLINYIKQSLYGLRGIVTDSLTGMPITARVEISGHDTDSSHVYSKEGVGNYHRYLYDGNYQVTFSKNGYYDKTIDVSILNDQVHVENVALVPYGTVGIHPRNEDKKIINTFDVLGRKSMYNWNNIYIHQMSDGTIQKTFKVK